MGRKLYVGNLPYSATQQTLHETFSQCGTVDSATMITDRDTGQSEGFGFVEMSSDRQAQKAIQELNGATLENRQSDLTRVLHRPVESALGSGRGSVAEATAQTGTQHDEACHKMANLLLRFPDQH